MRSLPSFLAGLLVLTVCSPLHGQSPIWLQIDLSGVPVEISDVDRRDAESKLRALIIGELTDPFKAWNWNPHSRSGALLVEVTFHEDDDSKDISAKFTFPKLAALVLPSPDKRPFIKISNRSLVAPLTNRPSELVKHLHARLKPRLEEMRPTWSDVFCAKVPVAQFQPLQLNDPPLGIFLPFTHPSYLWNWFDVKAKEPGQGDVTLAAQSLKTVVNDQLAAVIRTWIAGKQKIEPPPANAEEILVQLQDIRIYLQTLEPTTDPDYQGARNP
jgi:hypothetical protein